MHVSINVKSPNNISKWQMEFNSAFKGLISKCCPLLPRTVPVPLLPSFVSIYDRNWDSCELVVTKRGGSTRH